MFWLGMKRPSTSRILLLLTVACGALFVLLPLILSKPGIETVWAIGDGDKIKKYDLLHPDRLKNSVWDGRQISIFGARNEVVAFQVILQAGAHGARAVDVELPELHHESGFTLRQGAERQDPTHTVDVQIERFLQHYLHITKPSPPGWFYNPEAAPKNMTGWIPDALVPFNATGKGETPFDIGPLQNQGVWFDVYIPKTNAPAGMYHGNVLVVEQGRTTIKIPVAVRVYDFTLPDDNHFQTMLFIARDGIPRRHRARGPEGLRELVARYHRLAHRHGVELTDGFRPDPPQHRLDLLTGAAFTRARGYEGPGEGVGYRIVPANFYGGNVLSGNRSWRREGAWAKADTFVEWIKCARPGATTFLYVIDEPPRNMFGRVREAGAYHHANPGPGKDLPMFVTVYPDPELGDGIDIWCPTAQMLSLHEKRREEQRGRRMWYYNGHRPYSGTQITDAPAVDCRVPAWACWKHDIELWFYWHANHWFHNYESERGHQNQNVWVDPITFGDEGGINGDGVLIYAGEDAIFPEEDRGIPGPIASIRLKNIRRGAQDYEYLWLAQQNGLTEEARTTVDACVPRVFSDAMGDVSWSEKGSDWDRQRLQLARKLEQTISGERGRQR